ncbi:riboflavin synthase [Haloglycomyces albus]|uniref:riboflavin synthase n=1 Tax=Haloglycomyces albus TaxID=526067 RepID=UPI00046D5F90|nr:riboflavin synthase [Haloglycomyces albus]
MFTGIIEELGVVSRAEPGRITVHGPLVTGDASIGDSISVNGICLTVTEINGAEFHADVMRETYERSDLGKLEAGSPVNLERAATLTTRLGGHLVQGHVDTTATITHREPGANWETVTFDLPGEYTRYIVEKGSIAVDGVSLTVVAVDEHTFSVSLIPETLSATTLGKKNPGDTVHIEVDLTAKHIEKLLQARKSN